MADVVLLQQYLDGAVFETPEKIAVTDGNNSLCFRELSVLSSKMAHGLKARGVTRQDRVVICLQRSVSFLPSVLGILKADAIYVPLDHKTPAERWAYILEDAAPKVLICDSKTIPVAKDAMARIGVEIPLMVVCSQGEIQAEFAGEVMGLEATGCCDGSVPSYLNHENDLAYILYTSGSTGRPKGVMISHANVKAYIDWATDFFNIGS